MKNAERIRKISSSLQYATYGVMAFWALFVVFTWANFWYRPGALPDYLSDPFLGTALRISEASPIRAIPAGFLFCLPSLITIYGLWHLSLLFRLFKQGLYFSEQNSAHLFLFSLCAVIEHLLSTPIIGLADYVVTIGVPEKAYGMPFVINGDELTPLLLALAFLTIAWIFKEATKIANENKSFV